MRNVALGGPVLEYKTDGHQRDRPRKVSPHVVRQELFHPGVCGKFLSKYSYIEFSELRIYHRYSRYDTSNCQERRWTHNFYKMLHGRK